MFECSVHTGEVPIGIRLGFLSLNLVKESYFCIICFNYFSQKRHFDLHSFKGSRKRVISNGSIPKRKGSDSVVQLSVNDKDVGEENKDEFFSQNCPSSRDSQQAFYEEMKDPSPSCETDFINATPPTFEDVWFKEIALQEQPSKYRVKSAPCRTERYQLMFRRKARSAGKKMLYGVLLHYLIVLSTIVPYHPLVTCIISYYLVFSTIFTLYTSVVFLSSIIP